MKSPMPPTNLKKFILTLALPIIAYACYEAIVGLCIDTITEATKGTLNRIGILFGYMSAVVAGCFIFWDWLTENGTKGAQANIKLNSQVIELLDKVGADTRNNYGSTILQIKKDIDDKDHKIREYEKFKLNRINIFYITIALLIVSAVFILLGASDSEKIINGKPHTCKGKIKVEIHSLPEIGNFTTG
ncbi:hypothetical protein [Delftia sp. HK171]|uniref:hypothetical protein n=1 Tax=Delftia sp. HK171 TaxID=1920191 RepID=UPI00114E8DC1|nr:hypothetical protein [Delftia sp. HK171]